MFIVRIAGEGHGRTGIQRREAPTAMSRKVADVHKKEFLIFEENERVGSQGARKP